jgi:hypothetical protein
MADYEEPNGEKRTAISVGADMLRAMTLLVMGLASVVGAQTPARDGLVRGVVTDTAFRPLADASVEVVGWGGRITTTETGRFEIRDLPAGRLMLVVRHIGYAPVAIGVELAPRDTQRLSFALERLRSALDTVRVTERLQSFRLSEFEERRKMHTGQYLTAEQIEKRRSTHVSDLLRTFNGVMVSNTSIVSRRPNNISAACPVQAFVDGVKLPPSINIENDLPDIKAIAGIELYAGPSTIPLQYKSIGGAGFCGVLLVWTK